MQPVSPEIFAEKWNSKFEQHLLNREAAIRSIHEKQGGSIPWLTTMMDFGSGLLSLILHAQREAKWIGLDPATETADTPLHHAWEKMELSKVLVTALVQKFQDAKNGNLMYGGGPWRDLPLSLRRRINDFVVMVGDIKAKGQWVVDGER